MIASSTSYAGVAASDVNESVYPLKSALARPEPPPPVVRFTLSSSKPNPQYKPLLSLTITVRSG
jgi:hypothetical protein